MDFDFVGSLAVWIIYANLFVCIKIKFPKELYEAADVDGANKFTKFWRVTLPLLTPTIFFNLVMQMINGFLAFTQSLIITQGKSYELYTVLCSLYVSTVIFF